MPNHIPSFEGHPVDGTSVKVSGKVPVEDLDDVVLGIDDVVQMVSQFRCTGVYHEVDPNGNLVRVQTLKPVEMALMPFDLDDESDQGIVRNHLNRHLDRSALPAGGGEGDA